MNHKETCDRRTGSVNEFLDAAQTMPDNLTTGRVDDWVKPYRGPFEYIPPVEAFRRARNLRDTVTKGFPKVTSERVEAEIDHVEYFYSGTLTICVLTLKNGYKVTGESACISVLNYNVELGCKLARKNATEKVWNLEGYLLREQLYQKQQPAQLPVHLPVVEPEAEPETGWLIEWSLGFDTSPVWLRSSLAGIIAVTTRDAEHALRFACKQDASAFVALNPDLCEGAKITEHIWID